MDNSISDKILKLLFYSAMTITPNAKIEHQKRSKLNLEKKFSPNSVSDSTDELPLPPTPTGESYDNFVC